MLSHNMVVLLGNVGRDPEMRSTNSGNKVCNLSVATTKRWTPKGSSETKEKTEWHHVVVWGNLADVAEKHLRKGSAVYIQGELQYRKYTNKAGAEATMAEIVLDGYNGVLRVVKSMATGSESSKPANTDPGDMDDEIPF